MKTKYLTIIFLTIFTCVFAKLNILQYYSMIPPTTLPCHGSNSDKTYVSSANYWFNYHTWNLNSDIWRDLGLTKPESEGEDGLDSSTIFKTFTPTNGNYKLMAVYLGGYESGKSMLISMNKNGEYIDAVEIAATILITANNNSIVAYPKQWSLSADMKVTVYQLKPTSATPLMADSNINFPLQAQRVDKVFQIDSTGQFSLVQTKLYQPQNYTLSNFSSQDYKIRLGNESLNQ